MNTIVVIDRQFGSGGLEVAHLIASHYDIPCYDRNLLAKTAAESGLSENIIKTQDETPSSSFIFSLIADTLSDMPLNQEIFFAQQETIRKIARDEKAGFVIVGRCADVALRKHDNLLSIFIHATEGFRMDRIKAGKVSDDASYSDWSDSNLLELMRKKDKERWRYYDFYSQKRWGQSKYYDLTINSGLLGIEMSARQIISVIDSFEENGGKKLWMDAR